MAFLRLRDDGAWELDGKAVGNAELLNAPGPIYCWHLTRAVALLGPEAQPCLEHKLIDLGIAAQLYNGATGNTADHGPLEDCTWLQDKVGMWLISLYQRAEAGIIAACENGFPVNQAACMRAIDALIDLGVELSEKLEAAAPAIWETYDGEVQTTATGLPIPSDNVSRHAVVQAVKAIHGVTIDAAIPLSKIAEAFDDVPFVADLVRYRRVLHDIKKMTSVSKDGHRCYFGTVGIRDDGTTFWTQPSVAESVVRRAFRGSKQSVLVDYGSLELQIAKRVATRNGNTVWPGVETLQSLGRLAAPNVKASATLHRIGREILRGAVSQDSVAAITHRLFPNQITSAKVAAVRKMLDAAISAQQDPWASPLPDRLVHNLLAESHNSLAVVKDWELAAAVVRRGNDELQPASEQEVLNCWAQLAAICRDPVIAERLTVRVPGVDLHADIFAELGQTWAGRQRVRCSRSLAGRLSVYGTLDEVTRELLWLAWRSGAQPICTYRSHVLLEGVTVEQAKALAQQAQERVLGSAWVTAEVGSCMRWR